MSSFKSSEIIAQSPTSQSVIVPPPVVSKGVAPATDTIQYFPVFAGIKGTLNKSGEFKSASHAP